jgi:excinuclease ABC subunit C
LAPCEYEVSEEKYEVLTQKITRFLSGNHPEVKKELMAQMQEASEALQFEKAKELRDLIMDIDTLMEKQHVSLADQVDRDVFGFYAEKGYLCVQVFFVRQGKLLERNVSISPHFQEPEEDFLSFVGQFYYDTPTLPKEIVLPMGIDEKLVTGLIPEGKIVFPQRGTKRKLVDMATENARIALSERLRLMERDESKTTLSLTQLADAIGMDLPKRIEAFDNSNIQGTDPVSAMVVFIDGKPAKKEYRKYKIRTVTGADDYETMREVVRRRYSRVLKENLPLPDLILIDGGKGQLASALDVLENELGISIPVGGMAKNEKHQTATLIMGEPPLEVPLKRGTDGFYLLQRIQDEVHRFALSFHRQTRSKSFLQSTLDNIPGVGEKRKQQLYRYFGSIDKIKEASIDDFQKAGINTKLAENILAHLADK